MDGRSKAEIGGGRALPARSGLALQWAPLRTWATSGLRGKEGSRTKQPPDVGIWNLAMAVEEDR